jgi:glycosyltransferase involved in cell wall biosynthesis
MLAEITPVILTWNEAPNIARTLEKLRWAREVVVVDSFSDDGTAEAARAFPNVRRVQRRFDRHASQWNFAIGETGITTRWILALDADYVLTDELVRELGELHPDPATAGYEVGFTYCVRGKPLRGSAYPPVVALFRAGLGRYEQDGHTQRVRIAGAVGRLAHRIRHDDRKAFGRWMRSQERYARLEAEKLLSTSFRALGFPDQVRRLVVVAPLVALPYCLFVKGNVLDGSAGLLYAAQRTIAEAMISLRLLARASRTIMRNRDA